MAHPSPASTVSPAGGPFEPKDVLYCTVCDDRFLVGALVMLRSLMDHVSGFDRQRLKIFFDDQISSLSAQSQNLIREVVPHVEFEPVANPAYRNASVLEESHRAAYLTLEAFRVPGFRRVVFFDVDMLCLGDFGELLDHPADFMACRGGPFTDEDSIVRWTSPRHPPRTLAARAARKLARTMGITLPAREEVSINSGFMLIGERHLGAATYDAMNEQIRGRQGRPNLLDQHIINDHFHRLRVPVRLLPHTYNFRDWGGGGHGSNELFEGLLDQIKVIHFSGYAERPKPWESGASDRVAAIRVWRDYAKERFGSDFLTEMAGACGP